MSKKSCPLSPRLGSVGGQAVMEGVMMRGKEYNSTAVRKTGGEIVYRKKENKTVRDKCKLLNLPLIRGVVNFVEMLIFSMDTLTYSAEVVGLEDEEETKFEKWLKKKFGISIMPVITAVSSVFAVVICLGLFYFLPTWIASLVLGGNAKEVMAESNNLYLSQFIRSLIEGVVRIVIFLSYISLCTLMKDIRRTFEYHGAEHKCVFCHEAGEELTVENVRKFSRFHPRCGTSFLVVMMVVGILVSSVIPSSIGNWRILVKILTIPVVVGLGYEFIRYAGRHNNLLVRILSAPGLWCQRLTTKEPDDRQIEVAIVALKTALPDIYPEETAFDNIEQPEKSEKPEEKADNED